MSRIISYEVLKIFRIIASLITNKNSIDLLELTQRSILFSRDFALISYCLLLEKEIQFSSTSEICLLKIFISNECR